MLCEVKTALECVAALVAVFLIIHPPTACDAKVARPAMYVGWFAEGFGCLTYSPTLRATPILKQR